MLPAAAMSADRRGSAADPAETCSFPRIEAVSAAGSFDFGADFLRFPQIFLKILPQALIAESSML